MSEGLTQMFDPQGIERRDGFLIAGFRKHYVLGRDMDSLLQSVSCQWHSFRPHIGNVAWASGRDSYGVCLKIHEGDTGFDYMCGMVVSDAARLSEGFTTLVIPALRYAVFRQTGPSSMLPNTYFAIFGQSLPDAGLSVAEYSAGAPEFIEYFGAGYDMMTETGGPDILVPLKD